MARFFALGYAALVVGALVVWQIYAYALGRFSGVSGGAANVFS